MDDLRIPKTFTWLSGIVLLAIVLVAIPAHAGAKERDFSIDDFDARIGRVDDEESETRGIGLAADSYHNPRLGFSLTWDDMVWTASDPEDAPGEGVFLTSETSQGVIIGGPVQRTPARCVENSAEGIGESPAFSEIGPAPSRYDRPVHPENATGELYVAVSADSGAEIAFYIECREIESTNTSILITFGAPLPYYENELRAWQEVFDAIEMMG